MRRGRGVVVLWIVASVAAAPAVGLGLPTPDDDAGTGGDAPGDRNLAVPIGEGEYRGSMRSPSDVRDVFRIEPPAASVVRLFFLGPGGRVDLIDPANIPRHGGWSGESGIRVSSIGAPSGTWWIDVSVEEAELPEGPRIPYNFTVTFERHAHVASAQFADSKALAFRLSFASASFARVDAWWRTNATTGQSAETDGSLLAIHIDRAARPPYRAEVASAGIGVSSTVASVSAGGDDLSIQLPTVGGPTSGVQRRVGALRSESAGPMDYRFGSAENVGVAVWAYWVWDGDPPVQTRPPAHAAFWTVSEFEGGSVVQAASLAYAQDRVAEFALPLGQTSLMVADAQGPFAVTGPPRMEARTPGGTIEVIEDTSRSWFSWEAEAGEWQVILRKADGAELGRCRLAYASFGF